MRAGRPDPARAGVDAALGRLTGRIQRCSDTEIVLQELAGLIQRTDTLYDPVADGLSVRLPGELARRLCALADGDTAA